ncbi:mucoidy inhibitor MuiA family protein [Verrucomicrobiota bacterium]
MFRRYLVFSCLLVSVSVFADVVVDSTLKKVTVCRDRAQVTRVARVKLEAGSNKIRFENLPERTEPASLQAVGTGDAMLADVQYKVEHFKAIPDEQRLALYAKRDELYEKRTALDDSLNRLRKSKGFLEQISKKVTFTAEREAELELDPAKWDQMLALYAERAARYDLELRKIERDKKTLQKEIEKVEAEIRQAGFTERRRKYVAELELVTDQAGRAMVELSYIVRGPTWTPTYDVRVDTPNRNMAVSYYGNIRQSTGEDWTDVELRLSTANPGLGGQHPELRPWRIDERRPIPVRKVARPKPGRAPQQMFALEERDVDMAEVAAAEPEELRVRTAEVQTEASAVVFAVKGASSIASDNVAHRVAISQESFKVAFRYSAVPKLAPYAYLKAKAVNGLDYPLLPGRSNVFLDGNFITASRLELIAPLEEFWVFLGADEGVKVEHKLVRRYRSTEGLTGRRVRHKFEYEIKLHNTHSVTEDVVVWDQIPISGSEAIKVQLVKPRITKTTRDVKMDEDNFIEWNFQLKPNQEITVPFEFYVEAPVGVDIGGLEIIVTK